MGSFFAPLINLLILYFNFFFEIKKIQNSKTEKEKLSFYNTRKKGKRSQTIKLFQQNNLKYLIIVPVLA